MKKLGEVAKITTGSTPSTSKKEYYNGNKQFVSPADIQGNRYIQNTIKTLTELGLSKGRLIKKGSVLFVCIGSTIGKTAQATKNCITNQQLNSLSCFDNFNNDFVFSLLQWNGQRIKLLAGVQAVPQINKTDFSNLSFPFPTLPEQTRIAHFFTTLDKKLNQLQQKKSSLEAYKKGMMQQIFSQELRFKPARPSGGNENGKGFPDWEVKRLGEVLTIGSGKDYKHLKKGNIPVYGSGGYMTSVNEYLYDGESVCIGRKGTIDKPKYFNEKFWTVDTLFYTHSFINVLPKFVFYLFLKINWKMYNEASGVPSLSKKTIDSISIELPTLKEQTQIANFLTKIDDKINAVNAQIEKTKTYKKGLLQRMFV